LTKSLQKKRKTCDNPNNSNSNANRLPMAASKDFAAISACFDWPAGALSKMLRQK